MTALKPPTFIDAIDLSVALTKEAIRLGKFSTSEEKKETHARSSGKNKRKLTDFQKGTWANNNNNAKKGKGYMGNLPKCDNCWRHHTGRFRYEKCDICGKVGHAKETCWNDVGHGNEGRSLRPKCDRCGKEGHSKDACWAKYPKQGGNDDGNQDGNYSCRVLGCFKCGDVGHFRKDFPRKNQARKGLHDRSS
ncbi:cold shock domain-containing protein 3-like [Helianthus annuus]|uniref:cold shock domain-containing protein 3-like n=1 Tax=Helianthus annuus TaxID=4232 RepID=UPI000B8FB493|nr:cold shock domain-containing protein 3-like [Helianthus annuus]